MRMYQLPKLMMKRMPSVPRATKSPCAHKAPRPYGLSTVSLVVVAASGAAASEAGAAIAAGAAPDAAAPDAAGSCARATGDADSARPNSAASRSGARKARNLVGRVMLLVPML